MDLPAATSPELTARQSHSPVSWEASSPCADEMQTDSPSNLNEYQSRTPELSTHGREKKHGANSRSVLQCVLQSAGTNTSHEHHRCIHIEYTHNMYIHCPTSCVQIYQHSLQGPGFVIHYPTIT